MTARNLFGDLNLEATQSQMMEQMALLLLAILEKMPRVDAADRLVTNVESSATLATTTNMNMLGSRDCSIAPFAIANSGVSSIYDNIKVS